MRIMSIAIMGLFLSPLAAQADSATTCQLLGSTETVTVFMTEFNGQYVEMSGQMQGQESFEDILHHNYQRKTTVIENNIEMAYDFNKFETETQIITLVAIGNIQRGTRVLKATGKTTPLVNCL